MTQVSVIIPAFNAQATLARTVRSAMAQTHADLEILVVDDGSTDATRALAESLAVEDGRVSVLHQANAGVAKARNLALSQVTSPFTTWLDADDIWHPTKIEKQLAIFNAQMTPPSLVYTGYRLIDAQDTVIPNFRTLADTSGRTLCRQLASNFFSNVSSILVPTDLVRQFGGHDPRLRAWGMEGAEDFLLQMQLSTLGPITCCREALVGYRMHQANMSLGHSRAAQSNLKAIDLIAALQPDLPNWVLKLGRARTVGYALHMLRYGNNRKSLRLLWDLMQGQPGYTMLTLFLILQWQARTALGFGKVMDPDVGRPFDLAQPELVPWEGHMILTGWHERALVREDSLRNARVDQEKGVSADLSAVSWPGSFACGSAGAVSEQTRAEQCRAPA